MESVKNINEKEFNQVDLIEFLQELHDAMKEINEIPLWCDGTRKE